MEHHVKSDPLGNKQSYAQTPVRDQHKQEQQRQYHNPANNQPRPRNSSRSTVSQSTSLPKHHTSSSNSGAITGSIALLNLILTSTTPDDGEEREEDYEKRTNYAQQLDRFIMDASTSGVIQWHRQDMMQIVEMCTHYSESAFSTLLGSPKVPLAMKENVTRILASAACQTRLDLLMGWLLDRLNQQQQHNPSAAESSSEYKSWLLSLLQETIIRAQIDPFTQRQLQECMPSIMNSLIQFLDSTECIKPLGKILTTLSSLADYYSTVFVTHFQDIVDLLVGWYLDVNVSDETCHLIRDALISYGSYWKTNVVFGFEILQHFISDLYARVQAVGTCDPELPSTEIKTQILSCNRLLSCFHCLSRVIVPLVSSLDQYDQITMLFRGIQSDTVMLFLQSLNNDTITSNVWFEQSNQIMLLMSSVQPKTFHTLQHSMYYYITAQLDRSYMTPLVYISYLLKMVDLWRSSGIHEEVYHAFLDIAQSPLFPLFNKANDPQQQQQSTHQGLLMIMRHLFSTLPAPVVGKYSSQWIHSLQPHFQEHTALHFQSDTIIASPIILPHTTTALQSYNKIAHGVGSSNNVLLDPLVYCRLFLETATATRTERIMEAHEAQTIMVLQRFWQARDYEHFDRVLALLMETWAIPLWRQNQGLRASLGQDFTHPDCWFLLSLYSKRAFLDTLVVVPAVVANLLQLVHMGEPHPSIHEKIIHLIKTYCQLHGTFPILNSITGDTMTELVLLMNSSNPSIRKEGRAVLKAFDPFAMASFHPMDFPTQPYSIPMLKSMVMASPHTGAFRPVHYELVMKQLGMQYLLVGSGDPDSKPAVRLDESFDWARRLFHACGGTHSLCNSDSFQDLDQRKVEAAINGSVSLLYYWTLWECSRYCVLSRLRTPFGGPQQTFAAFEKCLHALTETADPKNEPQLYGLIILLDQLEMQISNATEGNTTPTATPTTTASSSNSNNSTPMFHLPMVPKGSFYFFYTNRKTCQDYFIRIRPLMVQCARQLHCDPLFLKHAVILLSDYESQLFLSPASSSSPPSITATLGFFEKVNACIRDIVDVCIHHQLADTIAGLEAWYQQVIDKLSNFDPSFAKEWNFSGLIGPLPSTTSSALVSWFQIAILFAKGHDEDAIGLMSQYINVKGDATNTDYFRDIHTMLNKHVLHFYTSLEDYDAIRSVCQRNPRLFSADLMNLLGQFSSSQAPDTQDLCSFSTLADADLDHSDSMVQLSRLIAFRKHMFSAPDNKKLSNLVSKHLFLCLEREQDDQPMDSLVFSSTRSHLIEIQLEHRLYDEPMAPLDDASAFIDGMTDTRLWARLANAATTAGQLDLYIKTAQVAQQQHNYRTASSYLEKVLISPHSSSMIKNLARYETIKLNHHDSKDTMIALDGLLEEIAACPPAESLMQQDLVTNIHLKMATVLEEQPQEPDLSFLKWVEDPSDSSDTAASWTTNAMQVILQKATECASGGMVAKPWFVYAHYHYLQACEFLDVIHHSPAATHRDSPTILWARDQWGKILTSLTPEQLEGAEKFLWDLFKTHSTTMVSSSSDQQDDDTFATSVPVLEKCQHHRILGPYPSTVHAALLAILDTLQDWLLTHFRSAIVGFSHYLDLAKSGEEEEGPVSSMMMQSTLYLVQILIQYGDALQSTFIHQTAPQLWTQQQQLAWKQLGPQLFSRLVTHPSVFVKQMLGRWISPLIDTYPHEMIYRVIVGLSSDDPSTQMILQQQADKIRGYSDDDRSTANNVWVVTRRMTEELEKITVLWEETWLHRISTLQLDVMNQWQQIDKVLLDTSSRPIADDVSTSSSKLDIYQTSMQHVIQSVHALMLATIDTSAVKTPHESWFETTFGRSIRRAFELLETPESLETYRKGWDRFQQIHRRLTMETQKVRVLRLDQVSPYLSSLQGETNIQMPGLAQPPTMKVCIHHFGTTIVVLPTKTKPKKMDIHGTDGNTYTYLFKGLEDLQLDERIMQLLNTTNVLLREDNLASVRHLNARTYAVVPMSDHFGMIQWVQQATPLFALYKNWQKRDYLNSLFHQQQLQQKQQPQQPQQQNQPHQKQHQQQQRATEYYIEKVLLKMKAQGLGATANRRHWPAAIFRSVHQELADETPDDILSKALWWSSTDSLTHLNKTHRLARSMAVMSMVGYVIGLGDRHLDNILMDDRTGEIIHIDYNVCFEKGTTLRVPERVPYRLTRNMVHALGIAAGVGATNASGGIFRTAAEHTLRIMRRHKGLLMGLMEDAVDQDTYENHKKRSKSSSDMGYRIGSKEEQQRIELQSRLVVMATRLAGTGSLRDKQHASIIQVIHEAKQLLEQNQHAQHLEEEDDDDDEFDFEEEYPDKSNTQEELDDINPPSFPNKSPPSDWEHNFGGMHGRHSVPATLQEHLKDRLEQVINRLNQPYDTSDTPLAIRAVLPLLDSIRMLEMDENNEIHVAQESAKMILDTLRFMDDCISKLVPTEHNIFLFTDLIEMLQEMTNRLDQYYYSLRMLESFGLQEQQKGPFPTKERLKQDPQNENSSMRRVRQKLEGRDTDFCNAGLDATMTVAEQVAKTIEQATCIDNLSLMYEGWTSWV